MEKNELIVAHGSDIESMVRSVLERADLASLIRPGSSVALKPNLVVSKPASSGATTHPEVVAAVISYLRDTGFDRLAIIEGSWLGDATSRAFAAAGYTELSARTGVPLVDLQLDSWARHDAGEGWKIAVCDRAMRSDFIVNLPVVKGHCQTMITCALKNLKGCMPDDEKGRFHSEGLHEPIARLNRILKPGFILADGICGDLDFEEGGNPVRMNRVLAARDPVLLDTYVCRLMGHEVSDVPYIGLAEEYGVGSTDLGRASIIELGDVRSAPALPPGSGKVRALATRIDESSACSACYAALIHGLARLEERGVLARLDEALSAGAGGSTPVSSRKIAIGRDFLGLGATSASTSASTSAATSALRTGASHVLGCGTCTRTAAVLHIPGCPPDATTVTEHLELFARGGKTGFLE